MFSFFKIVLINLDPLSSHMNFRINLEISKNKNKTCYSDRIWAASSYHSGDIAILTILNLKK